MSLHSWLFLVEPCTKKTSGKAGVSELTRALFVEYKTFLLSLPTGQELRGVLRMWATAMKEYVEEDL